MLRQNVSERIKLLIRNTAGDPITGLIASDFQGGSVQIIKADGSTTLITLILGVNLFEVDSTYSPGIYEIVLSTSNTNLIGQFMMSVQPQAGLFLPTYFQDWIEVDSVQLAKITDVNAARDSIKGTQLLDISTIAGGALFTNADSLHNIKTAVTGIAVNIPYLVWEELIVNHTNAGTLGEVIRLLRAFLLNRIKINGVSKQLEMYDDTGITLLKTYPLKDINGAPADKNATERGPGM